MTTESTMWTVTVVGFFVNYVIAYYRHRKHHDAFCIACISTILYLGIVATMWKG
jgi:Co/Zn/Cd efflux system component